MQNKQANRCNTNISSHADLRFPSLINFTKIAIQTSLKLVNTHHTFLSDIYVVIILLIIIIIICGVNIIIVVIILLQVPATRTAGPRGPGVRDVLGAGGKWCKQPSPAPDRVTGVSAGARPSTDDV